MYYHNVNEVYELTTNGKYNELIAHGQNIESIINVDLNEFDIENFEEFVFKRNGVDTELVDMDYYKTIYDNLNSGGFSQMTSFTVNNECFEYETKRTLYTVFHSIGNVVNSFLPKDITAN